MFLCSIFPSPALNGARILLMVFGSDDLGGGTFYSDSSLTHTLSENESTLLKTRISAYSG